MIMIFQQEPSLKQAFFLSYLIGPLVWTKYALTQQSAQFTFPAELPACSAGIDLLQYARTHTVAHASV